MPPITADQLESHARFLNLEIDTLGLQRSCQDDLQFNFLKWPRTLNSRFQFPEGGVRMKREHIERAESLRDAGLISAQEMVMWSSMLLLNDAFEFDESDADEHEFIVAWLQYESWERCNIPSS